MEQSSSIVTEIFKNRIMILIDTSKESDFFPDFKYLSFIKFILTLEKLQALEYLPCFQNSRKHPIKVTES